MGHIGKTAVMDNEAPFFFSGLQRSKIELSIGEEVGVITYSLIRSYIASFKT